MLWLVHPLLDAEKGLTPWWWAHDVWSVTDYHDVIVGRRYRLMSTGKRTGLEIPENWELIGVPTKRKLA